MFLVDEETADITLTQGDTGEYKLTGLPNDKAYTCYLAVQDKNRNPIGLEISEPLNLRTYVTLRFEKSLTDLLTVPKNKTEETYYFGVKICDKLGNEDTLLLGNKQIGENNSITVYPKKVEGDL